MKKTDAVATKGYFPFEYYEDFLKFIHCNKHLIEIITYNDIDWGDDYDYESAYKNEWKNWNKKLNSGAIAKDKIYLLIQHDVDVDPLLTMQAMKCELEFGIKSNVMMFNKRVIRKHFQKTGELTFDDKYSDEIKLSNWPSFEKNGFVFCYHSNPYEQAEFDDNKAREIFENDVKELRKTFDINFFSPHGGVRCPKGLSNNSLQMPDTLKNDIRWVANGATVKFNGVFSDGGPNLKKLDPNLRDLRDFVSTWRLGKRYRVITHPQYYSTPCSVSERLSEAEWYRDMLVTYADKKENFWAGVKLHDDVTQLKKFKIANVFIKLKEMIKDRLWR